MFSHMVIGLTTYCNGVGTAYTIGTWEHCKTWQVVHGVCAITEVIEL